MRLPIGIRKFDYEKDLAAVKRIWREVGWVEDEHEVKQLDYFFACGNTLLGTIDDVAECSVHTTPGTVLLGDVELNLCAVTAVTTSRIARGHAFAQNVTAQQLSNGASDGAQVAALGIFDQGFYDKLGFGNGAYDHRFVIDPANLRVKRKIPTPMRLSQEDFAAMHSAMCARHKVHGGVSLQPADLFRAELGFSAQSFGLGFGDADKLTHFIWLKPTQDHGPYKILFMAYQNSQQLLDLLALLKSLADQVYSVSLMEPPEIQLQSLLDRPFRNQALTESSTHAAQHSSFSWWQMRILDVAACVAALSTRRNLVFQLHISDPVEKYLEADADWHGVAGDYIVELGERSCATLGADATLPSLSCSVNAFTRWLWGVASASSLAITDDFVADYALCCELDQMIDFRDPRYGWDF